MLPVVATPLPKMLRLKLINISYVADVAPFSKTPYPDLIFRTLLR
jgi:hypothetical protein